MNFIKLTAAITLVLVYGSAIGQRIGSVQIDTANCQDNHERLNLQDKNVLNALNGAETYIRKIVGRVVLQNHVWLDYGQSRVSGFGIYGKDINHPQRTGEDTCFELQYFVMDKTDTIGFFQLLIDKYGLPITYEYGLSDQYNQPQLIKGFKKHFDNRFKLGYSEALKIGKQKGFVTKPSLQYSTENNFVINSSGEVFVKVKYYWSFFQLWDGGNIAILEINAESGKVEKEVYIPRMPG